MSAVTSDCLVALIFVTLKLRKILIVLKVLQTATNKAASASTVPSFIYKPVQTTSFQPTFFFENLNLSLEHGILTVSLCTLIVALGILIFVCKCRKNSTNLIVELTNGFSCVQIVLQPMSLCPSYWTVVVPQNISCISIKGFRSPYIHFDFDRCELINNLTDKRLIVKTSYRLSWLQAYRL